MDTNPDLEHKRHSLAHLLAAAVLELYPEAKNTIGPAIDNGFYYDFNFSKMEIVADKRGLDPSSRAELATGRGADSRRQEKESFQLSDKDLPKIEKKMRETVKSWKEFSYKDVEAKEALETYEANPYKQELIKELADKGEQITLYTSGKFTDLCKGGHAENPSKDIVPGSWKLSRIAGAYWRGDEKNKMLTRIYGLAFETKEELEKYITQIEEAKKRDHKKLGKELGLFMFHETSPGNALLASKRGDSLQ